VVERPIFWLCNWANGHSVDQVLVAATIGAEAIPIASWTAYCFSKAALIRLTDTLAAEVEQHGIAVFASALG